MGIRDIKGMYGLPHLAVNLWTVGVFTLAVTIINLPFTLIDKSLTPFWLAICANFCFITFYTIYTWGLIFQAGFIWTNFRAKLCPNSQFDFADLCFFGDYRNSTMVKSGG